MFTRDLEFTYNSILIFSVHSGILDTGYLDAFSTHYTVVIMSTGYLDTFSTNYTVVMMDTGYLDTFSTQYTLQSQV